MLDDDDRREKIGKKFGNTGKRKRPHTHAVGRADRRRRLHTAERKPNVVTVGTVSTNQLDTNGAQWPTASGNRRDRLLLVPHYTYFPCSHPAPFSSLLALQLKPDSRDRRNLNRKLIRELVDEVASGKREKEELLSIRSKRIKTHCVKTVSLWKHTPTHRQ